MKMKKSYPFFFFFNSFLKAENMFTDKYNPTKMDVLCALPADKVIEKNRQKEKEYDIIPCDCMV